MGAGDRGLGARASAARPGFVLLPILLTGSAAVQFVDIRVHDPVMIEADGRYYLFATGRGISAWSSTDLANWTWTDHGPVVRSLPGRDRWNAIDPNLVLDHDGAPWLVFGSFWSGIKLVRLAPDLHTLAQPETLHAVAARPNDAIEAPFIFRKKAWYYLFVSWDVCCRGAASTYKVMVGRSREIIGPYLDREGEDMRSGGGTLVVMGDSAWAGVGHSAAYTFGKTDYLIFHGYARFDEGRPKLLVREITWDEDGWPRVMLH